MSECMAAGGCLAVTLRHRIERLEAEKYEWKRRALDATDGVDTSDRIAELEARNITLACDNEAYRTLLREAAPNCNMYLRERIEAALDPA